MLLDDAKKIVSDVLAPFSYEDFFGNILGQRPLYLLNKNPNNRQEMLGPDPKENILSGYQKYAPILTSHIHTVTQPAPSPRTVESADAFRALMKEYHERGYTVRIPEFADMHANLSRFSRALELLVENPVGTVVFWSEQEAKAPVHDDEVDVIIIQLYGQKKWFVSKDTPRLSNSWKAMGEGIPPLENYDTIDVNPGDFLYLPRGTAHTVHSTSESIHLAIGFTPITIRDAVSSALNLLSDFDRSLRSTLGNRADCSATKTSTDLIQEQILSALSKLTKQCASKTFINQTLKHRRAKFLYEELDKIQTSTPEHTITTASRVRHKELAMAEIAVTDSIIDFRMPGNQALIHLGVEESVRFIKETPEFTVSDIPGEVGDDIRIALTGILLSKGFLEIVPQ